jgi:putative tryptophan/tyrosine transport system substrate-binding protein
MRRREFITLLGSLAAAWPARTYSQRQVARVGALIDVAETHPAAKRWVELFETRLGSTGWQKGHNIEINYRWGESNPELLARYAEELMQSTPDVFMVHGTPALIPLRKLTNTIPIVFTARPFRGKRKRPLRRRATKSGRKRKR